MGHRGALFLLVAHNATRAGAQRPLLCGIRVLRDSTMAVLGSSSLQDASLSGHSPPPAVRGQGARETSFHRLGKASVFLMLAFPASWGSLMFSGSECTSQVQGAVLHFSVLCVMSAWFCFGEGGICWDVPQGDRGLSCKISAVGVEEEGPGRVRVHRCCCCLSTLTALGHCSRACCGRRPGEWTQACLTVEPSRQ